MDLEEKQTFRTIIGSSMPKWRGKEFQEIIFILGRQSSKSTLASIIAAYEACCNPWADYNKGSEMAWVFVISVREKHAIDIGRNMIFSKIHRSPHLRSLIVDSPSMAQRSEFPYSKTGVMVLKTGAAITALPCSARVGRGYGIGCALLDEIAYYAKESKDMVTDWDIYNAILPSQIKFGSLAKRVIFSSPGEKRGFLWERYRDRLKNREYYTVIKSPTWKMRPDFPKEELEKHKRLSPLAYYQEYGAEFGEALSPLVPERDVRRVCREDNENLLPKKEFQYVMAIDTAFGDRDRFVIGVGHSEPAANDRNRVVIDVLEAIEPTYDRDIHDEAVAKLAYLYKAYDIFEIIADQYESDAFSKTLEAKGMNVIVEVWTASMHKQKYGKLRSTIKQELISLPYNEDMIDEFRTLQVKYLASGQMTVTHAIGGHDDFTDVIATINDKLYEEEMTAVGVEF